MALANGRARFTFGYLSNTSRVLSGSLLTAISLAAKLQGVCIFLPIPKQFGVADLANQAKPPNTIKLGTGPL
jgi:hypothetical protein